MSERARGELAHGSLSTALDRRRFLHFAAGTLLLAVSPVGRAAVEVLAVRVWPAPDYTRVTIEHAGEVAFNQFMLADPDRLVLDLEGLDFGAVLQSLGEKVAAQDPYIRAVRVGRYRPGIVRLVFDLKSPIAPQVFALQPIGDYGHRLVIDLYPANPVDPLMALLEEQRAAPARGEGDASAPAPDDAPAVDRLVTVVLDPGHGGEDPGAVGRGGSYEKHVTLQVARRLKARIERERNVRVVMTRDADYFVPLRERVRKARRVQADLFVSIHADAFVKPTARGSSVFVLSENGASSTAARWLAQRENAADLIGGVNIGIKDPHLARTLLDLSQTATINDSLKLGSDVLKELGRINTLHKPRVEQAGFAVLKAPDVPSILVETAFISNPEEEKRLNDERYQDKIASAIQRGIQRYFANNPPVAKSKLARAD